MIQIAVIFLLIFMVLGVPVAFAIGFSGLLAIFFGSNTALFTVVQMTVKGINSWSLMACPLFILAGGIMGEAKLSDRIVGFSAELVSWMRGGIGCVCVVANMIFAALTGSGAASISAIGGLVTPELKKAGYKPGFVAALIAGAGALGPIIPPSMNMIVFGAITGESTGKLFIGGVIPGIIIGIFLIFLVIYYARKWDVDAGTGDFSLRRLWATFKDAIWALIMPAIIIGGILGGVFTATEAGVVACIYGLICGLFIYRTVKITDLPRMFRGATEGTCMVMMIMGIAGVYSYIFAVENVGNIVANAILNITTNKYLVQLLILVLMTVVGMFMETVAAMTVLLPVLYPIAMGVGCDPIAFGVWFSISTVLGGLSPPVGVYLFQSMGIVPAKFKEVVPYMIPVVIIVIFCMILIIFVPGVASWLPNLAMN